MSEIYTKLSTAIFEGNIDDMVKLTEDALNENLSAEDILAKGLMPGMDHVGVEFKSGNMFVPEVLRSARAMHNSMDLLRPLLAETGAKMTGKLLLGTVKGDLHDIGKNLVMMMLKGAGFDVVDAGVDVSAEDFVAKTKENGIQVVGLSALLTTTMPAMEKTIKALKDAGGSTKVMIGGAPVTQGYADKIGADGYAPDAASAVDLAKSLL